MRPSFCSFVGDRDAKHNTRPPSTYAYGSRHSLPRLFYVLECVWMSQPMSQQKLVAAALYGCDYKDFGGLGLSISEDAY
jgi:hypothetical protein